TAPRAGTPTPTTPVARAVAHPGLARGLGVVSGLRGGLVVWGVGRLLGRGMRRLVAPMRPAATPTARSSPLP
ncbi:hypothetical protein P2B00_22100, partial [Xanthomonas perforans]